MFNCLRSIVRFANLDRYYVWDIEPTNPIILVREEQVQTLLTEINSHLHLNLRITDQQRDEGLVSSFPDHPRCLPRYLGRSKSRDEYGDMGRNAPVPSFRAPGEPAHPIMESSTLEEFKQHLADLRDTRMVKSKADRLKKQEQRLAKQQVMADHFKRTQRYLGLRPSAQGDGGQMPQSVDSAQPVPFQFDQSVVFVCVDVESWEMATHKITEVGVATLDTRDIAGVAPGQDGEHWRAHIKARHFRIKENSHLVNRIFVSGNPDGFRFGQSTFIPLKEAPAQVAACFRAPFAGTQSVSTMYDGDEKRKVIFLGHDAMSDVRYLQRLGFDPMKEETIVEALDTATMFRVWRREQDPTNLGRILGTFDIVGWGLHNAGNDAVYTVQAMLAICVCEATLRGTTALAAEQDEVKAAQLAAASELAM